MKVNTLVTHKKLKYLGIGCISKTFSKNANVNFGLEDVRKCNYSMLEEIDTSKSKSISFSDFKNTLLNAETKHPFVIVGNELRQYVGIGFVIIRTITKEDLIKYPRVV